MFVMYKTASPSFAEAERSFAGHMCPRSKPPPL
jgi:hypothetical protein